MAVAWLANDAVRVRGIRSRCPSLTRIRFHHTSHGVAGRWQHIERWASNSVLLKDQRDLWVLPFGDVDGLPAQSQLVGSVVVWY
tara:strand:- start:156 stop:407 length:252 start_codon:yes stop_codon:yes gene_type:complete